jgi:hypothetical protein
MPKCDTCGNDYDRAFQVVMDGKTHHFDCFECAIQLLAPSCAHCGCTIIGHGMELNGELYCCHHCARHVNMPPMTEQEAAPVA